MENIVEIQNMSKTFHLYTVGKTIQASENISLNVGYHEFAGIVGKSGSGKSTILKCLYRTYLPQQGALYYDSEKFGKIDMRTAGEREIIYLRKYEIGYVSQFLTIMPRVTAREVVKTALSDMGLEKDAADARTEEMLSYFELDRELWDSYPLNFSGGEKLRLNLARAMAKEPRLLLLDEPTASLDNSSKLRVRDMIRKLKEHGTSMLGIFHDIEFMDTVCDKVYTIENGVLKYEQCS
ncbi:MAG: ATP-binding cassette domain-containing protein [Treponema sp.]|nr:ATP-binding cassette domain-containing protein [Treponema sp.]